MCQHRRALPVVEERVGLLVSGGGGDGSRRNGRAVHHWAGPLGQPDGKVAPFKVSLLCEREEEAMRLRQDIAQAVHNVR